MTLSVEVVYGTRHPWAPPARLIVGWAQAAAGRKAARAQLAVRIVTPAESQKLNREFRGQNRPTNVLSFPAAAAAAGDESPLLGDLAICARIVAREASQQGKSLAAHWAHMVVHGVLHLTGYDHTRREDARRMERRERTLLKKLGFPNPYLMPDHG